MFIGFSCGDSSPLRDVFTVQRPAGVTKVTTPDSRPEEKLEWTNGEVTLIYSDEAGTQIIQHQDSLTDYCSISSSCSLEPQESDCSTIEGLSSLDSHSSLLLPAHQIETSKDQDHHKSTNPESALNSAVNVNATIPQLQAFTVLPVNETLWIPRRGGDVLVVDMQSHGSQLRGRVIAVLSPPRCSSLGILEEPALVAKDTVVCGFHKKNMEWCLCVWRGWGCRELEVFYQSYEDLGRLETSMRKRR